GLHLRVRVHLLPRVRGFDATCVPQLRRRAGAPTATEAGPRIRTRACVNGAQDFIVAIPARHGSTRLPGKPLRLLGGEPLIVHVARRARAAGAARVVVATDDARIADALAGGAIEVCMTRADHASGSDRLAECAVKLGWPEDALVVNLQGDEPFAPAAGIRAVADALREDPAPMATLAAPIESAEQWFDPNCVKVVCGARGHALYFSRAPIPWARDALALERAESLEQLRALEHGFAIAVRATPEPFPPGVDTEEDLARAEYALAALRLPS